MARLHTVGYESQIFSATANQHGESDFGRADVNTSGTVTVDTTNPRSGAACASHAGGAANYTQIQGGANAADRAQFLRAYLRFSDATPSSQMEVLGFFNGTGITATIRLNTNGTLTLHDLAGTQVGSASATLSDATWYRVEMKVIVPAAGSGTLEGKLNGTVFATSAAASVGTGVTATGMRVGCVTAAGSGTVLVDDCAINDGTGADQNSYPGSGKVIVLRPVAHSAIGNWVGPQTTGDDTTDLWDNVNNVPPLGVAHSDVDANLGRYVFNITNAVNQDFDVAVAAYDTLIAGGDSITLTQGIARMSVDSTTGTNTGAVQGVSNPAMTIRTGFNLEATAIAGTEPAGWKSARTTVAYAPSVTRSTQPVLRARKIDASTRANMIDLMGVLVEYAPAAAEHAENISDSITVTDAVTPSSSADEVEAGGAGQFFVAEPETLSVRLEVTGGQSYSFGPEREDEGEIPLSIEWSTQNPGGFADGAVTLTRPAWISAADAPLMASYRVENQGGELRYQGRVKATPGVDANTIRIEAEGLAAALDDNEYWRFLGVHNDLSEWGEFPIERQQIFIAANTIPQTNASVEVSDAGLSALAVKFTSPWGETTSDQVIDSAACEGWLDTGGMDIGHVYYAWECSGDVNEDDTNWWWSLELSDTLASDGLDHSGNLRGGPTSGSLAAASIGRKFASVLLYYGATSDATIGPSTIWWPVLSVFGTHGLTSQVLPDGRYGLLDQDIIEYAVSNGAPDIPLSAGFVDSGGFVVPHVVHTGTPRELIEQITAYGGTGGRLNDWGVYEAFFHRAPGWGETWRVRRDEVEFSEGGPTTEGRCQRMVVAYTDGAGRELSVGPPGTDAIAGDVSLEDSSPLNPVTKTRVVEGGLTSLAGATNIGVAALAEANAENRRGQVTITDTVRDSAGNERPASAVRACDYVVIEDEAGGYPPETQPIVGTSYSHDSLSVSCELGLPAPSVEALLARLATRTEGL